MQEVEYGLQHAKVLCDIATGLWRSLLLWQQIQISSLFNGVGLGITSRCMPP
jgi:hypothetical protein